MKTTNISKILGFLAQKPGYLKEGPDRLVQILEKNLAIDLTRNEAKIALQQGRTLYKRLDNLTKPEPVKVKRLFFDIETSYNIVKSWRIGYNLNLNPDNIIHERAIICLSYKWEGEDKVHSLAWDNGNDKEIVEKFVEVLKDATEVVGHNIDRFDLKWLMTRAAFHGILALPKYVSYDTLKKAKAHFNFNSNKLNYIGQFLGVGAKHNYQSKYQGLEMWDKVILSNDKEALKEMVFYCEQDVVLTEDVFNKLRPYTEASTHHGVHNGKDSCSCPNCGGEQVALHQTSVTRAGTIKRLMECGNCDVRFFVSNQKYLKLINV